MGYKLLIFLFFIFFNLVYASKDVDIIDKLVKDIKKERTGLSKHDIENAIDPFGSFVKKKKEKIVKRYSKKVSKKKFFLSAIVNKKAKINGRWFNLNSYVSGYKIVEIKDRSVMLRKGNRDIYLYLNNLKNKKFKLSIY